MAVCYEYDVWIGELRKTGKQRELCRLLTKSRRRADLRRQSECAGWDLDGRVSNVNGGDEDV